MKTTGVPTAPGSRGTLRTTVSLSLALHVALTVLAGVWLSEITGGGKEPVESSFVVSLLDSAEGDAAATGAPPAEVREPEPDPVPPEEEAVAESPAETPTPEPTEPPQAVPAIAGRDSTRAKSGSGAGTPASSEGQPTPRFRPPQLLAGALPIDPEDSDDLNVPSEIPVRLRVGTDGKVIEIVPDVPDLPPAVLGALERSARIMRFIPARIGEDPVEAWFSMTFIYRR